MYNIKLFNTEFSLRQAFCVTKIDVTDSAT